jgi:hypothetical protein
MTATIGNSTFLILNLITLQKYEKKAKSPNLMCFFFLSGQENISFPIE